MNHIVISSPNELEKEVPQVIGLFKAGLKIYHLRKPKFTKQQMAQYINEIPTKYHNRIMLHSFHKLAAKHKLRGVHLSKRHKKKGFKNKIKIKWFLIKNPSLKVSTSFHSISSLKQDKRNYDYVMISPVFDSISKKGYSAAFNLKTLTVAIQKSEKNVLALGGINAENVSQVKELGFYGFALLGSIWNSELKPVEAYKNIIAKSLEKPLHVPEIMIKPVKIQL